VLAADALRVETQLERAVLVVVEGVLEVGLLQRDPTVPGPSRSPSSDRRAWVIQPRASASSPRNSMRSVASHAAATAARPGSPPAR
jgi:hypothetical protein